MVQGMGCNDEKDFHTIELDFPAFSGDPYNHVTADTLEDFKANSLHNEPVSLAPALQDKMNALRRSDAKIVSLRAANEVLPQTLFNTHMRNYLTLISGLITDALVGDGSGEQRQSLRQLDNMLRWKCCQISREDQLMISASHPMELAVRTLNEWLSEAQERKKGSALAQEILRTQKKRHSSYMIYSMDQIYLRTDEQMRNARVGIPFYNAGNLTEISSVRLIEKVKHFCESNPDRETGKPVRVACLGQIEEPEALGEYYRTIHKDVKVELIQFKHDVSANGLSFCISDSWPKGALLDGERRVFNLLKPSDLEVLFGQYDIILFMDEGCFYCQGQEEKALEERRVLSHLEWLLETADQEPKKENKILYYKQAYRTAGEWLNGQDSDRTARLQFNQKLLWAIQSAMKPKHEVYLYVSLGKQIPGQELFFRDVCNDENYDGKELSVYKIPFDSKDMSEEVEEFLSHTGDESASTTVDFWKLIKSIGNHFYLEFLKKTGIEVENIEDVCRGIYLLMNTELVITREPSDEGEKLQFLVRTFGDEAYCEQVDHFMQELLNAGYREVEFSCVREYLHRLMGNAVISRAMDVKGILTGYLLKTRFFDSKVYWGGIEKLGEPEEHQTDTRLFERRRTVLSVIDNLSRAWIRDYENKEDYLMYEFRNKYCPGLSEEILKKLLTAVNQACGEMGYTDSRLYNHSKF